jgi:hypothetical protein
MPLDDVWEQVLGDIFDDAEEKWLCFRLVPFIPW